ncbi:MAG: sigma-54 dependent transcriptional regulator [Cyclobacteriaceae bacterium]|nr:sigma-54 dependent transcriptional regulator [Cyclobacteriaceae bacterium]
MKEHILIVDDSHDMLEVLRRQLSDLGYRTYQASNVMDALDILKGSTPDLLITDLQMPGVNGIQLVKYASEHFPDLPVLVITGYPSVEGAIDAVKSGAIDYLVKPFTKDELNRAINKSMMNYRAALKAELTEKGHKDTKAPINYHGIIGQSEALEKTKEVIERIKDNKVTVLINGESGTGKELVARAIHYCGRFAKAPFVPVNCGAIPENLLESELFGFVKGAFTGADSTRAGFFQAADGGTIFLDEIGNASPLVQQRLLRVLQEKEVSMIGSHKPQKIDVRIMAATNSDLKEMIKNGNFREDLYYRLNVVNIEIPPLRDRKDDIPLLANFFIRKFSREFQRQPLKVTPKAMEIMIRYHWPGNIRELENTIQRALIMADDEIDTSQLPVFMKMPAPETHETDDKLKTLEEVERDYIKKVLIVTGNNKTKAANILGITRKTLRQKLG